MKIKLVLLAALLLAACCSVGFAQSTTSGASGVEPPSHTHLSPPPQTAEELAKAVADAFASGEWGQLDAERPYLRTVRLRVEHSITGGIETRSFRTLERLEQWLKSGARQESGRNSGTLRRCRKRVCTFEQEGMLHNNLYMQRITYGLRRGGRPYVKAIHLLDGD